jgi:hypothetical protein
MTRRRLAVASLAVALVLLGGTAVVLHRTGRGHLPALEERGPAQPSAGLPVGATGDRPPATPGSIAGRVLDRARRPLRGASVVALLESAEPARPIALTESAANGTFALEGLQAGRYVVSASLPGFQGSEPAPVELSPGQQLQGLELALEAGGIRISGVVLDSGGGAIPGATVMAAGRSAAGGRAIHAVKAGGDGRYAIGLPRGPLSLTASAVGYTPSTVAANGASDERVDFRLEPGGVLRGHVVNRADHQPVSEAEVVAQEVNGGLPIAVKTDDEGAFRIVDAPPGSYQLRARRGPLAGRHPRNVALSIASAGDDVLIEVDGRPSLSGRVLGSDQKPIAGASVHLLEGQDWRRGLVGSVRSGEDGRYKFEGLLPGRYLLHGEAPLHAAGQVAASVADQDQRDVDVVLRRGAVVVGTVLTGEHQPVAGAVVSLDVKESGQTPLMGRPWPEGRSDGDGRFRFEGVDPGQVAVAAVHPDKGRGRAGPIALAEGEEKTLDVILGRGGAIGGVVKWQDGKPAPSVPVVGGWNGPHGRAMRRTETDGEGRYLLDALPAGRIVVVAAATAGGPVQMGRSGPHQATVELGEDEIKKGVDLTIAGGRQQIEGTVVLPDGSGADGARLTAETFIDWKATDWVVPAAGPPHATFAQQDGSFVIDNLSAGLYTLSVSLPGYAPLVKRGVPAGQAGLRLALQGEASLSGVVVGRNDKPVRVYRLTAIGQTVASGEAPPPLTTSVDAADGRFELTGLRAGTYQLEAQAADGRVGRSPSIAVEAGDRKTDLRLTLERGTTARLRVLLLGSNTPVAGARVDLREADQAMASATTDENGWAELTGLTPEQRGTLVLQPGAGLDVFVSDTHPVSVPAGEGTVELGTFRVLRGWERPRQGAGRLGLTFELRDRHAVITSVNAGSAAAGAGLRIGDVITGVDDQDVDGLGFNGLGNLLVGPPQSDVKLALANKAGSRAVTIRRGPSQ